MTKLLTAIAAAIASFATCVVAQAADLPMEPVYKAPVIAAVYNWTGFYIGANAGYGWGNQDPFGVLTNRFDAFSVPFSGWMLGGTAGAQFNRATSSWASKRILTGLRSRDPQPSFPR